MDAEGIEPSTSAMWGQRSNQLSYASVMKAIPSKLQHESIGVKKNGPTRTRTWDQEIMSLLL